LTSTSAGELGALAERRRRLLRRTDRAAKLVGVAPFDISSLLALVEAEQERTARQIASLEAVFAAIVEASELISTDDEHDAEGPTVAYERAQATALLRQVRADLDTLAIRRRQLELVSRSCVRDAAATSTSSASLRCRPPLVVSSARPDRRAVYRRPRVCDAVSVAHAFEARTTMTVIARRFQEVGDDIWAWKS
jgi:hypothetical protein